MRSFNWTSTSSDWCSACKIAKIQAIDFKSELMSEKMDLEVHAMGWWLWAPICRTRAYFRLLACLTSIHTYHPLEFCFVNFAFVISAFWEPKSFCTHSVFSCKIPSRALHRNIAMLPRGSQTPMKCFRCQGVPCAPMQGSSLLRCSNVMFLHNKCPTRPCLKYIEIYKYKCTNTQIKSARKTSCSYTTNVPPDPRLKYMENSRTKIQIYKYTNNKVPERRHVPIQQMSHPTPVSLYPPGSLQGTVFSILWCWCTVCCTTSDCTN